MSSFIQRTYDQLSQDLAINNNPATILIFGGGIYSADMTHLGIFDISMMSNIPNLVYLAPTNKEEYLRMLEWSIEQREYPVAKVVEAGIIDSTDYSKINKSKVVHKGRKVAIIATGDLFELGRQVKTEIDKSLKIDSTLINPVYLSGVDKDLLEYLKKDHSLVITLESGILDGGYGEKISRFYSDSNVKVLNYGARKEFTDRMSNDELFNRYRLIPELIVKDVRRLKF